MVEDTSTAREGSSSAATNPTGIIFAWAGAIFINLGFIFLVTEGMFSNWLFEFAFAAFYTGILLASSIFLKRRNGNKNIILTSLLLLSAVIAIAVTGAILPLNLIKCAKSIARNFIYVSSDEDWVTNTSSLPTNVQEWWNDVQHYRHQSANFAHLPNSDIIFFSGNNGEQTSNTHWWWDTEYTLWKTSNGSTPVEYPDVIDPTDFTLLDDNSTVCFINDAATIVCTTNGDDVQSITPEEIQHPRNLYYSDGLIWFRERLSYYESVLYSINPFDNTELTRYSHRKNGQDDTDSVCDENHTTRITFTSLLFVSAIPSLVLAFVLGFRYKVPSMTFGAYLSLTWTITCFVFIIDPGFEDALKFFKWWSVLTSAPYLIVLALAHLTNRMKKEVLSWGLNFAGLVFIVGMFFLMELFAFWGDTFWRWAVFTAVGIFPLIALSIITGRILLMVLASIGLMIDVWRLTAYITDAVDANGNANAPIQFIVLALSGFALAFAGYILSKYQSRIQEIVNQWAEANLGRWRVSNWDEESHDTVEEKCIEEQIAGCDQEQPSTE